VYETLTDSTGHVI